MNKSKNEELNCKYIKEYVQKYLETDDPEDCLRLAINIFIRAKDGGTVPSPMRTATRVTLGLDPGLELEDVFPADSEPGKTSSLITEENGEIWMPLFTGYDEIDRLGSTTVVEDRLISDIIEEAFNDEDISGLVINPFSDGLSLRKELLYAILHLNEDEDSEAG